MALATAACTRSADETEIGAAPAGSSAGDQAAPDGGGNGTGADEATGSRLDQGGFGDLENVCHDGEPGTATEVGLTADEIHLGTVTDKGSAERPGLTQEMYDAAVAFAGWCNEHGGIGGRKVVIDDLDAKLFEYNQRIAEACFLSMHTVRTHVQSILVKLGVHSKLEAAIFAIQHRLVQADGEAQA